ncbi:MAG: transposase [Treponema sp.]|nr:transposase [Treponema sp.]
MRSFFAKRYFGIEKTSQLIQRLKGEPNLRLLCGFTDVPGKATFSRVLTFLSEQDLLEKTVETRQRYLRYQCFHSAALIRQNNSQI